jgi:hypothetical protein
MGGKDHTTHAEQSPPNGALQCCSFHSIMQHQCHLLHNKQLGYKNVSVYGTGEVRREDNGAVRLWQLTVPNGLNGLWTELHDTINLWFSPVYKVWQKGYWCQSWSWPSWLNMYSATTNLLGGLSQMCQWCSTSWSKWTNWHVQCRSWHTCRGCCTHLALSVPDPGITNVVACHLERSPASSVLHSLISREFSTIWCIESNIINTKLHIGDRISPCLQACF